MDTLAEKFWAKVDKSGECWIWTGSTFKGYGYFRGGKRKRLAHRVAWELTNGLIPSGLDIAHRCDNPPCVRPDHLEAMTHLENMRDMYAKGRDGASRVTHCPMGHEYNEANTYRYRGRRNCRACHTWNTKMPDVTLVVATHNRPAMLRVMLLSMLASAATVPKTKTRILVVDDASETMEAKGVARQLGVDYLRLSENRGVAGALVAGFEQVDSPLYALWGDDDAFLLNWFKLHLAKIAEGYDVVAGSYWRTDANLNRKKRAVVLPVATLADLRQGRVTCNDGALVRRSAVDPAWFRPERERAMMMTFWLAMASAGRKFTAIREPTWLYRRHDGNLSNQRSEHDNALRAEAMAEYAT